MWRLTIHQHKAIDVNGKSINVEQEVLFEDENPSNLMDLVRYISECNTPSKTWYTLEDMNGNSIVDRYKGD